MKFLPEIESVKKAVADLKRQNINKIIAIGHSGITLDKEIANQVPDVDIVIGGHSNTFLYKGITRHNNEAFYSGCYAPINCNGELAPLSTSFIYFIGFVGLCPGLVKAGVANPRPAQKTNLLLQQR